MGAGAEIRQALGVAVFWGMLGVTAFGLVFTPMFYVLTQSRAATRALKSTENLALKSSPPSVEEV